MGSRPLFRTLQIIQQATHGRRFPRVVSGDRVFKIDLMLSAPMSLGLDAFFCERITR